MIAGSTALVAFGADSLIEVTSALALLWRLYRARAGASVEERSAAERRALYVVAATFFALGVYTAYESIPALLNREAPETSTVGLVLSVLSLIIMMGGMGLFGLLLLVLMVLGVAALIKYLRK